MEHSLWLLALGIVLGSWALRWLAQFVVLKYRLAQIPLYGKQPGEWSVGPAQQRLLHDPIGFISRGLEKHPGGYRIPLELGDVVVLPPQYGQAVNSNSSFTSLEPLQEFLRFDLPGGDGLYEIHNTNHDLLVRMLHANMSQNSTATNHALMDEASAAFDKVFGVSLDWTEVPVVPSIIYAVSRLSTRVLLGQDMCTNEDWLRIVSSYVIDVFVSARSLRWVPTPIARVHRLFSSAGRGLRRQIQQARSIAQPYIDKQLRQADLAAKGEAEMPHNAAVWLHEAAKGRPYDAVAMQLGLASVGIHTTTDLLSQTLLEIATHPEIVEPLREEIAAVVNDDPEWLSNKASIQSLKLLDSVIKETQRIKPIGGTTTQRRAHAKYTLPSGLVIPAGSTVFTAMSNMWNPAVYPDPQTWNPHRYLKMRSDKAHARGAQLVAPSAEHLGFGQGTHARPGRFFAAAEIKVALVHVLLNYDLEAVGGKDITKPAVYGLGEFVCNPTARLRVRRRDGKAY